MCITHTHRESKRLAFEHWHSQMFALHVFHFMFHERIYRIVDSASNSEYVVQFCYFVRLIFLVNSHLAFKKFWPELCDQKWRKNCISMEWLANGNSRPGTKNDTTPHDMAYMVCIVWPIGKSMRDNIFKRNMFVHVLFR